VEMYQYRKRAFAIPPNRRFGPVNPFTHVAGLLQSTGVNGLRRLAALRDTCKQNKQSGNNGQFHGELFRRRPLRNHKTKVRREQFPLKLSYVSNDHAQGACKRPARCQNDQLL